MLPIRNLTRPRTNASLLRGSVLASAHTCSAVTGIALPGYEPGASVVAAEISLLWSLE